MEKDERWVLIARALFDDYVVKKLLNEFYVLNEDGNFDQCELGCLAAKMEVCPNKLHETISAACGRISKEVVPVRLKLEDEITILKQAAKLRIRQSSIIFDNYKRELPRLVKDVNEKNQELALTTNELKNFIKPLFIEVINEVLSAPK